MNPYVSWEQAKRLKKAGYDQAVEKTRKHYIKPAQFATILLTSDIFDYWDETKRYAAPTVEEMMMAIGTTSKFRWDALYAWIHEKADLKESLVNAFEALKERD